MMHKRLRALLLTCILILSCAVVPVGAVENSAVNKVIMRSTGQVNHTIQANSIIALSDWISLDKDEEVRYNCTYTSKSASVDFGLIDSDDVFHYQNCTSGSISETIRITKAGQYKIAIRNNASYSITVTGNIRY